jgi:hypothetical protein
MIGKIERLPLREVWEHEARDFTPWMEENYGVLNEVLDITLVSAEREIDAGDFSVDLVAEEENGGLVVIENQLEKSDHAHLGKLITYLTSIEARAGIWVVAYARPEHVKAIASLNESSAANFYLIKVEAIRIGESMPAPLFTLVVGPSIEAKKAGQTREAHTDRLSLRQQFWSHLLEYAKTKTNLHANITAPQKNWIGAGSGKSGLTYRYYLKQYEAGVELQINKGPGTAEENRTIFNILRQHKEEIEEAFGEDLEWYDVEGVQRCRIYKEYDEGGWRSAQEEWPQIHEVMVDAMIRLEKAFSPYIRQLPI